MPGTNSLTYRYKINLNYEEVQLPYNSFFSVGVYSAARCPSNGYISKFAKEIKLDSITFQKLRVEKFSPLKEIVESTPGYYYGNIGGPVYSDRYGHEELKRIRNQIRSQFYDLRQIRHIVEKLTITRQIPQRTIGVSQANKARYTDNYK